MKEKSMAGNMGFFFIIFIAYLIIEGCCISDLTFRKKTPKSPLHVLIPKKTAHQILSDG